MSNTIVTSAFLDNPYATYAQLRAQAPLVWSDEFFDGAWLITRHADVEHALRNPLLSAQRTGGWVNHVQDAQADTRIAQKTFQRFFARAFLFLDGADHQRLRQVLMPAFRPSALSQQLQTHLQTWCTELVDNLPTEFDFMEQIAGALPAKVIAHLMGIPPGNEAQFAQWAQGLAAFIGAAKPNARQLAVAQSNLVQMLQYFETVLLPMQRQALQGEPSNMVQMLLQAQSNGQIQSHTELLAQTAMLLFAGYETTRNLLGNGMLALLRNPAQWQTLCQNPELVPNAVRELLRYDSPVQWTGRRATQAFEWHGCHIKKGDLLIALIGSANHDSQRHQQPDQLDITRSNIGALSFGSGAHVCIGAGLTQLEAQTLFSTLVARRPHLQLNGTPLRDGNPVYRGLRSLPMQQSSSY